VALATASKTRTPLPARIAPRLDSLSGRLIAAAAVWIVLGLVGGGLLISDVFRTSVQSSFDARLKFDLDDMIAAAEVDPSGNVSLRTRFADPRFERVYSGWYWQIMPIDAKGADPNNSQISRSLFDRTIKITDSYRIGQQNWGHGVGPDDQNVRVVFQRIEFPVAATKNPNDMRAYNFLVAGDVSEVEAEVQRFNGTLIWSFALLGLGLILAIFIQVRVGLQPLRRVSEALARIRDGDARRLEGKFPSEIAPLAGELNSLIRHSEEVVGRARTHVSNLAHSLKTPLTVLTSEAAANPGLLADTVHKQATAMRRQVDHYLVRARAAGALDVLGSRTQVKPVLEDLARVLSRIHSERAIAISVDCAPSLYFRGEKQDLEEMVGNLMDNACKWALGKVLVSASKRDGSLTLAVGDDGAGLDTEEKERVGERGERLDESVPGTGLGLAIVRDIAKLYGGFMVLGDSPLGGLQVTLTLPLIASSAAESSR
jgi:signal transduction histidine kinase